MDEIKKSIEVMKLLFEVTHLLRHNMMKGFEGSGMTSPQGMVIGTLSRYGRLKLSDLSDKLGLSNSTVSGMVDRLEQHGMVERIRSKEDRRIVYIALTGKFEELHKDFHKKTEENIQKVMSKGTPEDMDKVVEGLNILKRLMQESGSQGE